MTAILKLGAFLLFSAAIACAGQFETEVEASKAFVRNQFASMGSMGRKLSEITADLTKEAAKKNPELFKDSQWPIIIAQRALDLHGVNSKLPVHSVVRAAAAALPSQVPLTSLPREDPATGAMEDKVIDGFMGYKPGRKYKMASGAMYEQVSDITETSDEAATKEASALIYRVRNTAKLWVIGMRGPVVVRRVL